MKKKTIILSIAAVLITLLLAVYLIQFNFYSSHFLPGTKTNGQDITGLTVNEAEETLAKAIDKEQFVITENNVIWKEIPLKELGVQFDFTQELKKIMDQQSKGIWFVSYFSDPAPQTMKTEKIDDEAFQKYMANLDTDLTALNSERTPTSDATIAQEGSEFKIVPEVLGTNLDVATVEAELEAAIRQGEATFDLAQHYVQPTVTSENEELKSNLTAIHSLVKQKVTYLISGQQIVVPEETISSWFSYDSKNHNVSLEEAKLNAFVSSLGAQYNTSSNPTTFTSTKRGEVSVPAGTYSWTIAVDTEVAALKQELLAGTGVNRAPAFQGSAPVETPLIGTTYIEVDLQNQHMYYYKDGVMTLDTDIVSGKPSTPTPPGVFYAWNKDRDSVLRGNNDDGTKYAEPVDYWVPIDWTGVGIHDSDWQPAYGGQLWQSVGSHGCINTPPQVMTKLFEMIEVGVPVLVF